MCRKSVLWVGLIALVVAAVVDAALGQQRGQLLKVQADLSARIPGLHCLDRNFAVSGQPEDAAYELLAREGFRTVLSLRTASEGVDLARQKELVEKAGMAFINIPVSGSEPKAKQADEFLRVARDCSNYPILINCASGNRAAGFWAIYRAVVQDWDQNKAISEAESVGLTSPVIKKFVAEYIAGRP